MCMYVLIHACVRIMYVCASHMSGTWEARRVGQIPWNWSYS